MSARASSPPAQTASIPTAQPMTFDEHVEVGAILAALVVGALMAVWTLLIVRPDSLPLVGSPNSVASQAMFAGILITLIAGPLAYGRSAPYRDRSRPGERRHDFRWSIAPITLGATLVTALAIMVIMEFVSKAFVGVSLNRVAYTLALMVMAAVVAYIIYSWLSHIHAEGLLYLALFALFGSLLFSGARNDDPYWWQYSFSHLGMTESNSKAIFNIGLAFTGILVLAWHQYFIERITALVNAGMVTARARRLIRIALIAAAVCIALVGIVRFGIAPIFNLIHDLAAVGMGVAVGLILLFMPRLMPVHPRRFYVASYVMLALMLVTALVKVLGYIDLTGLEMYEFMVASLWLILFMRNTDNVVERVLGERMLVTLPASAEPARGSATE